jgi:hypothetical protein
MKKLTHCILLTTAIVVLYVFISGLPVNFGWIFLLFLVSEVMLAWMVIRILKSPRASTKTFDSHFYEDSDVRHS